MLTLIAGIANNGAIGRDNTIPWDAPEDLAFFARETAGGAVIMGRKTWESLPKKPLPRRLNIVVTSHPIAEVSCAPTPEAALDLAYAAGHLRLYGMGGAGIYAALLPLAERMLLTSVGMTIPDADTFFPEFAAEEWTPAHSLPLRAEAPKCTVTEYLRKG
ncbi:dihydrofolate reductase [Falsirhodobacter sp. alg1]|uniref:dihydrofolate reductase n=1 Tax=Falsirhodobacter sp. alg1 TaxID=1472418 RepID=UPI0005F083B8|nr:dihydrofolate reductase [Falsirhodobacter sp. alg1]